jgi:hypothetical protein
MGDLTMKPTRILLAAALAAGCSPTQSGAPAPVPALNALSRSEQSEGWRLLFDGRSTAGWRLYDKASAPEGWQAINGELVRTGRGGDIITTESFRNFDLSLEWKLQPAGNSGVFYRAALGSDAIYFSAPEMQILDDRAHVDGKSDLTSAGAVYGLYPARDGVARPVGEWNTARILVNGNHVEHWLNGQQIAAYELGSDDWSRRVASSKFKQWPEYGKAAEGHIGLQDHGDFVAYRNIKIRVLP